MANREGSAGAGLCPPIADGSPPPCSWWGREDPQQGREGSRVRGSSQTYLHSQRCGIYAGGDWRQTPASVSPSTSGMPVVQSAASAEPEPELCGC